MLSCLPFIRNVICPLKYTIGNLVTDGLSMASMMNKYFSLVNINTNVTNIISTGSMATIVDNRSATTRRDDIANSYSNLHVIDEQNCDYRYIRHSEQTLRNLEISAESTEIDNMKTNESPGLNNIHPHSLEKLKPR